MNCPTCGKEMSSGWLHGGGRMLWSPREDKPLPVKGREDVLLFRDRPQRAFLCRDCHQVVLSYLGAPAHDVFYQ